MKEIVEWLIGIEQLAGALYREAEIFFKKDTDLSAFLQTLGEDEAWHFHIMGSAAEYIRVHPTVTPAQIVLDGDTRRMVETPFVENQKKLTAGLITKDSILSCIVTTEFSEWNDLFLYVVNSLKEESREFQYVAARMQGHLEHILDFLETRQEGIPFLEKIRSLPQLWRETILIVEDSEPLMLMLERLFGRDYKTLTAENGKQGLEKIKEHFVDVIVSDIDMPEMNGIEFFQKAIEYDKDIGRRFLFFSGLITEEHEAFIDARQVPYLQKPASVIDIKRKVVDILERNRHAARAAVQ
jgi:CheY-like chemotaxis protein